MDEHDIYDEDLPASLRELRDLIGINATLKLVESWGGIHLKVPGHYRDDHHLVRIIGQAATVKLVQHYGATPLYIPRAARLVQALRNIEIAERYDNNVSAERLAREYGISERQIWNILKRPETVRRSSPHQPRLFD